jgi:cell division cycle protein 20 (cofactor of APC complex)
VDEKLNLDSEGKPFRMLVFRGSPKSSKKSIRHIDQMQEEDAAALRNSGNQCLPRRLPKVVFISNYFYIVSLSI